MCAPGRMLPVATTGAALLLAGAPMLVVEARRRRHPAVEGNHDHRPSE
ncbi:hypothetical protein ACWC5I_38560 [Kitasatospora sp. NPDC001574]